MSRAPIPRAAPALLALALSASITTRANADGSDVVAALAPQTPAESPPETAATPVAEPAQLKPAAAVAGGIAIVAVGAGAIFGVLALNDKSRFESAVNGSAHLSSVQTAQAGTSATENAVLADVCFGGALVAAVTSIILLVRNSRGAPEETMPATPAPSESKGVSLTLVPSIASHGAGAGAALVF